ncbi:extracellular solute-binding protein [Paenibacillus sp. CF384]|uniref:extracellular solute-binding protein n=1 Tax=Paenibacillus sp. CF384 TaxID=1884382 RepID=UPI000897A579|nr:extracellular solute-binding protein [Paenibacillus sp. CF384]SDW56091.1 putative aldouronate transport system substrate-binding protein [Paenibacillus sp. CF384]
MKTLAQSAYAAISICVLLLALPACDYVKQQDKSADLPLRISIFAQQDTDQNLKTNDFSRLLEQKFNVSFDWRTIRYEAAKEKRQISLSSGNYPDAYILTTYIDQFTQADVLRYGKQGIFYPLNDLIDRYAPNIKAAFDREPGLRALNTAPDGNIYGLASFSDCFHCSYPYKLWLNDKWLKKLNLNMPKTTEELRVVLRAFKNGDPNGNGLADEIPLSGSTEDFGVRVLPYLMNGFVYDDDRTYVEVANGQVSLAAITPQWREGLKYVKSLYDEGLIDAGAFTQNADAYKQLGENAGAEILGAGTAMHPAIFVDTGLGNKRGGDYVPVPPLQGPYASYAVYYQSGSTPGAKFAITDKASPDERIALIRIADYLYTPEGQANAEIGKEGLDWRRPLDGEQALDPNIPAQFASIVVQEADIHRNTRWSGMGHFYMPKSYRNSWVQDMDIYSPNGYERRLYQATKLYAGHEPNEVFPMWSIWIDSSNADEESLLQSNMKHEIDESAMAFITGQLDLEKDWGAYVKGIQALGASRYVSILQQAYNRWIVQENTK